ncbi:MAG: endolytic transglycosylase MltG [Desulfobacteraceae bacterium]|nr:endolytic transglycosylase MltG [Desulfobacteraceae bacterium]
MKRVMNLGVIFFLLAIIAGMTMALALKEYASKPLPEGAGEKIITIPAGKGFVPVLIVLQNAGLKISPFKFRLMAMMRGDDKKIKAGEYQITPGMTPAAILEKLVSGKERLYRVTLPEGYAMTQIAEALEKSGWPIRDKFMELARDGQFITSLGIHAETLEGYLFPDTYYFPRNVSAGKVITLMTGKFKTVFSSDWAKRAQTLGMSVRQIVILASIIEKETGASFERPIISSVFHNRLKLNMRLESDPTVIYGIENFDGNLTRKHLQTTTPYNTYKIEGLPHGPIANPGRESIHAALYPSDTRFLFFVSKNDGTHYFSSHLTEHNKAVEKYQKRK